MTALTILTIAALLLLALLVYGILAAVRRRRLAASRPVPQLETHAGYRKDALSHAEALSARHTAERLTEDDMQAASLGPRGVPGEPSPAKMTPQRAKKTPRHLEPGHTA